MVLKIIVDDAQFKRFMENLPKELEQEVSDATLEMAAVSAKEIRRQLLMQTKIAPRTRMANRIEARKLNKRESAVFIPIKAHFLDTMIPHWVALKRGRLITNWTKKYYGRMVKTGRSKVFRGPRGGILFNEQRRSYLWVTPDPFVNEGQSRARRQYDDILKRRTKKALEEASR
jgi:hypothetical protein